MGIIKKLLKRLKSKDEQEEEFKKIEVKPQLKRIVVVGDGSCGKTSLIRRYLQHEFIPNQYSPTLFDVQTKHINNHNKPMVLVINDTAGQKDLDALRPSLYYHSDVIVVCFSVDDPTSLANIQGRWKDEISRYCGDLPVILVGTKSDLATEEECEQDHHTERCEKCRFVSKFGETMASVISADKYMECSALQDFGIDDIFTQALDLAAAREVKLLRRRSSIFRRGSLIPFGLK